MMIILSVLIGACVSLFGIWAFIKGQESMAEIVEIGKPQNIKGPITAIKETLATANAKDENADFGKQLQSMFSDKTPKV